MITKEGSRAVTQTAVDSIEALCLNVGVAIENTLTYRCAIQARQRSLRAKTVSEALVEISTALSSEMEKGAETGLRSLVVRVMEKLHGLLPVERVTVFLVDTATQELYSVVNNDFDQLVGDGSIQASAFRIPMGSGIAGYVATTGEILNIDDAYQDERFNQEFDAKTGFVTKTVLCLPITDKAENVGVLQLINKVNGGSFDPDEVSLVSNFCSCVGVALQNSKLYLASVKSEQASKREKEVTQALLDVSTALSSQMEKDANTGLQSLVERIMEKLHGLLPVERVTVFLVDTATQELYSVVNNDFACMLELEGKSQSSVRIPMGSGIAGYVATTGEILNIDDAYQDERFNQEFDAKTGFVTKTVLCLPIDDSQNQRLGVMQLINKTGSGKHFDAEDTSLVRLFCGCVGVAMRNSTLYLDAVRSRKKEELEKLKSHILLECSSSLLANLDLHSLIKSVITNMQKLMSVSRATLFLLDPQSQVLWSVVDNHNNELKNSMIGVDGLICPQTAGLGPKAKRFSIGASEGLAGSCAQSGEIINIEDAYGDPRFLAYGAKIDKSTNYHTKSILCIPVFKPSVSKGNSHRKIVGVLQLIRGHMKTEEAVPTDPFTYDNIAEARHFGEFLSIAIHNAGMHEEAKKTQKEHLNLLQRLLPSHIVTQLHAGKELISEAHKQVHVLFSDVVGFTNMSSKMSCQGVMRMLNEMFNRFDNMCTELGVYKVETIGDAYMCCTGLDFLKCEDPVKAILKMAHSMLEISRRVFNPLQEQVKIRIGIHSGPAYAGTIGKHMPRYCFFGDTINTASRMESTGQPMQVQVSAKTYLLGKHLAEFEYRGEMEVKGKGHMSTYFLKELKDHPETQICEMEPVPWLSNVSRLSYPAADIILMARFTHRWRSHQVEEQLQTRLLLKQNEKFMFKLKERKKQAILLQHIIRWKLIDTICCVWQWSRKTWKAAAGGKLRQRHEAFMNRMVSGLNSHHSIVCQDESRKLIRLHRLKLYILQHWINKTVAEHVHFWFLSARSSAHQMMCEQRENNFLEVALSRIKVASAESVMKLCLEEWLLTAGIKNVPTNQSNRNSLLPETLFAETTEKAKLGSHVMQPMLCLAWVRQILSSSS